MPMHFLIRDVTEGGSFQEYDGDLAIGGVYFLGRYPPAGNRYELRFRLPGNPKDLRVKGEVLRVRDGEGGIGYHLKFVDLDVSTELTIARYLDNLAAHPKA